MDQKEGKPTMFFITESISYPPSCPLQNMYVCPEEESVLMSSFVSTLSALSIKQGNHKSRLRQSLFVPNLSLFKTQQKKFDLNSDGFNFTLSVENKEEFDMRALRLDWMRLQVGEFVSVCQISGITVM